MEEFKTKLYQRTKESFSGFRKNPLNSFALWLPILIAIGGVINGVVIYIQFVVNGGYEEQVHILKTEGIKNGLKTICSLDGIGQIVAEIDGQIFCLLALIEICLMTVTFFRSSTKTRKTVMIVDLGAILFQIAVTIVIFMLAVGKVALNGEAAEKILQFLDGFAISTGSILFFYEVIAVAAIITFSVLITMTEECKWMLGYMSLSLGIAYFFIPIIIWFLQIIVPIIGVVLVIVVCAAIGLFFIMSLFDSSGKLESKKETLKMWQKNYDYDKQKAEGYIEGAKNGGMFLCSKKQCQELAGEHWEKAERARKEIERLQKEIDRLERKH